MPKNERDMVEAATLREFAKRMELTETGRRAETFYFHSLGEQANRAAEYLETKRGETIPFRRGQ